MKHSIPDYDYVYGIVSTGTEKVPCRRDNQEKIGIEKIVMYQSFLPMLDNLALSSDCFKCRDLHDTLIQVIIHKIFLIKILIQRLDLALLYDKMVSTKFLAITESINISSMFIQQRFQRTIAGKDIQITFLGFFFYLLYSFVPSLF
jgi:hypothetical protein